MHIVVIAGEKTLLDTEVDTPKGVRPGLLPYKAALDALLGEWIRVAITEQIPMPYRKITVK